MQADSDDDVRKVERQFAALSVVLERAVQDMVDEAELRQVTKHEQAYVVPQEVFEDVRAALKAIHDLAHDLAFGGSGVVVKGEED